MNRNQVPLWAQVFDLGVTLVGISMLPVIIGGLLWTRYYNRLEVR